MLEPRGTVQNVQSSYENRVCNWTDLISDCCRVFTNAFASQTGDPATSEIMSPLLRQTTSLQQ